MKGLHLITACLFAFTSYGQQIFSSLEMESNEPKTAFYLFVKGDAKEYSKDIDTYLNSLGKLRIQNDIKYVDLKAGLSESELVSSIGVNLIESNDFNKLVFFFLDREGTALGIGSTRQEDRENFIFGLYDLIQKNEEERLLKKDLELAESNVKDAEKEKNKIEKSIERNLRDQEKLGKRLDASPEELSKLINEKNTVLQQKLSGNKESDDAVDTVKLDKELSKAEKEILKRKKKEKKDSSKLEQKERQLEDLSQELFSAQNYLKKMENLLSDKERMMRELLK